VRALAWIGLALVLLLAVGIVIADRVVTGMVNRDPLRSQIDALVDEALGRDVAWRELGVRLLPPSLVIEEVTIAGTTDDAPLFAEAENVQLRVALAPLLARAVVVDSLFVRGAKVRLILTEDGFELPELGGGKADAEAKEPEAGENETSLAIRSVELEDAQRGSRAPAWTIPSTWRSPSSRRRAVSPPSRAPPGSTTSSPWW
jgi:uncharacterized protein involved in outer membrane biogenesis